MLLLLVMVMVLQDVSDAAETTAAAQTIQPHSATRSGHGTWHTNTSALASPDYHFNFFVYFETL